MTHSLLADFWNCNFLECPINCTKHLSELMRLRFILLNKDLSIIKSKKVISEVLFHRG